MMGEKLTGSVSARATLTGAVNASARLTGTIQIPSAVGTRDYEGPYEFTPSESAQSVEIEGLKATANIVIEPIPSNYGLITWDGSKITVS